MSHVPCLSLDAVTARGAAAADEQVDAVVRAGNLVWLYLSPLLGSAGLLVASACTLDHLWDDNSDLGMVLGAIALVGMGTGVLFTLTYPFAALTFALGPGGTTHLQRIAGAVVWPLVSSAGISALFVLLLLGLS